MRKTILTGLVAALFAVTATAQDHRKLELSVSAGYTFSDGVSGKAVKIGTGGVYNRVDPLNAFSWGARVGFLLGEHNELGFLFSQQSTDLDLGGTSSLKVADVAVRNYHGYFAYNFLAMDSIIRPHLLIGFGATQYSPSNGALGGSALNGNTKFSGTLGAGIKLFPEGKRFGLNLEYRWTPTYIKSDATGFWCDPYWGCYTTSDAQYSNQFQWSGGIMFRF
jgi:hypothetical protein